MSIRKHIPNTITCLSLLSGCVASVMALHGNLLSALIWIIIAAVFDFCDGFAARLLKAYSPMGKELDSLSDMVSFGFAPGMVVYWLLGEASTALPFGSLNTYIPYLAFVIPTFSGLRLAKFNIDEHDALPICKLPRLSACRFRRMLYFGLRWDILFYRLSMRMKACSCW